MTVYVSVYVIILSRKETAALNQTTSQYPMSGEKTSESWDWLAHAVPLTRSSWKESTGQNEDWNLNGLLYCQF